MSAARSAACASLAQDRSASAARRSTSAPAAATSCRPMQGHRIDDTARRGADGQRRGLPWDSVLRWSLAVCEIEDSCSEACRFSQVLAVHASHLFPPCNSCSMPPHFKHSASVCRTARGQPVTPKKERKGEKRRGLDLVRPVADEST